MSTEETSRGRRRTIMLRAFGYIFAAILIVNAIGTLTGEMPEDLRLLLLTIGGIGMGVVSLLERRLRNSP